MSIASLMRQDLSDLEAYKPSENACDIMRLNANELPWDPLAEHGWQLNRYPDQCLQELNMALAQRYQVKAEQLLLTRGSDEGIDGLMRLFVTPFQDSIIVCPPTFNMYVVFAKIQAARVIECPLQQADFSLDLDAIMQARTQGTKLLFICRPNNPTGNCESLDVIARLCREAAGQVMVVVDEAYIEFSQQKSATNLQPEFENLIVLKTLSKAYGLAGLRLGVTLASPVVIEKLKMILPPYRNATPTIKLAMQSLSQNQWVAQKIASIIDSRAWLFQALSQISVIKTCWPSEANFILIEVNNAERLMEYLLSYNVLIRQISPSHCRISIGDDTQNTQLINLLKEYDA